MTLMLHIVRNAARRPSVSSTSRAFSVLQTKRINFANQKQKCGLKHFSFPCPVEASNKYGITKVQKLQVRHLASMPPWMNPEGQTPGESLKKYSTDLTQMAIDGKLDPVIGRHEEIRRTLQILARRTKNNPILIGEPGTYLSLSTKFTFCSRLTSDIYNAMCKSTIIH